MKSKLKFRTDTVSCAMNWTADWLSKWKWLVERGYLKMKLGFGTFMRRDMRNTRVKSQSHHDLWKSNRKHEETSFIGIQRSFRF